MVERPAWDDHLEEVSGVQASRADRRRHRGDGVWAAAVLVVLLFAAACGTDDPSGDAAYRTPAGAEIEIADLTDDEAQLLDWSFGRFTAAGLDEPAVRAIDFDSADEQCAGRVGWTVEAADETDVVVCLSDDRLCKDINGVAFTTVGKVCLLHELAHAWMIEHLTAADQAEFLELVGLDVWRSPDHRWHERGVEFAAETLTWGLMDQPLTMIRIAEPPCELLADAFRQLTDRPPLVDCTAATG